MMFGQQIVLILKYSLIYMKTKITCIMYSMFLPKILMDCSYCRLLYSNTIFRVFTQLIIVISLHNMSNSYRQYVVFVCKRKIIYYSIYNNTQ